MWQLDLEPKAAAEGEDAQLPLRILLPVPGHAPTYTIGRKPEANDIAIPADKSLSRQHAQLTLSNPAQLTVCDAKSKFGTFVGERKLSEAPHDLADGGQFRVGTTTFLVKRVPLVFCASGLSSSERAAFKTACASLGGTVVKEWHDEVRVDRRPIAVSRVDCSPPRRKSPGPAPSRSATPRCSTERAPAPADAPLPARTRMLPLLVA